MFFSSRVCLCNVAGIQYPGSCSAGCSFGRMVASEESQARQQFSAWNHMPLQLEQNCNLPYSIPSTLTANPAFPGQPNLGVGKVKPIDAPRKRFLIFDHSGNRTRLFMSPNFSRQNSIIASSKVPASVPEVDHQLLVKAYVEEKRDENDLNDEEGEMVEDAEEINALLYSDSDDEYNDDDDDDSRDDEVSSTRHTLFTIEGCGNKGEEVMEEVGSSDGSPKRRKLVDGSCKRSSLARCGGARTSEREERVRVEEAVKMVESIIPGLKSKDPVSIIEKAIVYLERMKMKIGGGKKHQVSV